MISLRFQGLSSLGGAITAAVLNKEYQVTSIIDANSYTITATATANSSDTGNGGSSVVGTYQINAGLESPASGSGWGAGVWGRGTWSSSADVTVPGAQLRLWSMDNFGEDLLANVRGGGIYYWDTSAGTSSRAVDITTLSGNNQPQVANIVLVSERDRHVIAFGCDPQGDPGNLDPLTIRFSDQESFTDWAATSTNTAGELRIGTGSEIIAAVQTKQQVIILRIVPCLRCNLLVLRLLLALLKSLQTRLLQGKTLLLLSGDAVYWMGDQVFYKYDGNVQPIPCPIEEYVFDNMNIAQRSKVTAAGQ